MDNQGKLTIIGDVYCIKDSHNRHRYYVRCKCECGNEIDIRKDLVNTNNKSCGCLKRELYTTSLEKVKIDINKVIILHKQGLTYKDISKILGCGLNTIRRRLNFIGYKKSTPRLRTRWKGVGDLSGQYFSKVRDSAKRRQIDFSITIEQAWLQFEKQNGKCTLTGIDIVIPIRSSDHKGTASLDRIDSAKGYTVDNIQWIHKYINCIKMDFTQQEFIDLCKLVSLHNQYPQ